MTPAKLKCHGTTGVGGRAARAAQPARHAAGTGERAEVIRENSRREAPRMSSDLIRRSKHRGIACLHLRDARLVRWEAFCEVGLREISAPPTIVKDCGQPTFEVNVRSLLGTQPQRLSRCAGTFQPLASRRRRFSSRTAWKGTEGAPRGRRPPPTRRATRLIAMAPASCEREARTGSRARLSAATRAGAVRLDYRQNAATMPPNSTRCSS